MSEPGPRIPVIAADQIDDPGLAEILDWAEKHSTPSPIWYRAMAHNPEIIKARAAYWRTVFWGGQVDHTTKELMRLLIVQLRNCAFCMEQRSTDALEQGLDETVADACSLPSFSHPDPKVQSALAFARALVLDLESTDWDAVYADLGKHYSYGDIVELGIFASSCIGIVSFAHSTAITRAVEAEKAAKLQQA